jgi:hypothetical protein
MSIEYIVNGKPSKKLPVAGDKVRVIGFTPSFADYDKVMTVTRVTKTMWGNDIVGLTNNPKKKSEAFPHGFTTHSLEGSVLTTRSAKGKRAAIDVYLEAFK